MAADPRRPPLPNNSRPCPDCGGQGDFYANPLDKLCVPVVCGRCDGSGQIGPALPWAGGWGA
jgi:DnaJ-class molecular chaperone